MFAVAAWLLVASLLSGCSTETKTALQSAQALLPGGAGTPPPPKLDPRIGYLRLTVNRRVVFMGLGFIDKDLLGPVAVWFSGQSEVLRLQNGRIVGASGLNVEWRNVTLTKPMSWRSVAQSSAPVASERVRDVMPGYRYGLREELVVSVVAAPGSSALEGLNPQDLVWFEERVRPLHGGRNDGLVRLPPARYAVDLRGKQELVVYAEQCLSADVCFTWQRWSANGPVVAAR